MEPDEVSELKEHAEKGGESGLRPVAFTMSVLAVLVAVTHRSRPSHPHRGGAPSGQSQRHVERISGQEESRLRYGLATKLLNELAVADKDAAKKTAKEWATTREVGR